MTRKTLRSSFIGAALASTFASTSAFAIDASLLTATVGCDDFTLTGTFTADRDNVGSGAEAFFTEVVDGAGTQIFLFDLPPPGVPLGGSLNFPGNPEMYDTPPAFNPITLRIVSPAGNGLPEQVAFTQVGTCSTIDSVPPIAVPATPWWALIMGLGAILLASYRQRRA